MQKNLAEYRFPGLIVSLFRPAANRPIIDISKLGQWLGTAGLHLSKPPDGNNRKIIFFIQKMFTFPEAKINIAMYLRWGESGRIRVHVNNW